MHKFYAWVFRRPARVKWMMNTYLPLLFSGIVFKKLAEDYSYCRVELKDWFLTKNMNRSQYGGSLASMTDPAFALMLAGALGHQYHVWDTSVNLRFERPARNRVYCEFHLPPERVAEIKAKTANGEKYFFKDTVYIKDQGDNVVAVAEREVYVRLARKYRP